MHQALLSAVSFPSPSAPDLPEDAPLSALLPTNPSLTKVLTHPHFEDELRNQSDIFISYFANPVIIKELLVLISLGDFESKPPYTSQHALNAYNVLSLCNPKITLVLFSSTHLISAFFAITALTSRFHSTAQGYFLAICKAMLSEQNVQKQIFLSSIEIQKKRLVYTLVENLTAANASLIRALLPESTKLSQATRQLIIDYLIFYYLNGKFAESAKFEFDPLVFDTLVGIFRAMAADKIPYEYKPKYVDNLFDEKSVKPREHFASLFHFRVAILRFLAESNQLRKVDKAAQFLQRGAECASKFRKPQILLDLLSFFELLAKHQEFEPSFNTEFTERLFGILVSHPSADVLHHKVFGIFESYQAFPNKRPSVLSLITGNLIRMVTSGSLPETPKQALNPIALHFAGVFLYKVDRRDIAPELREALAATQQKVSVILKKFDVNMFEVSLMDNQSQTIQLLKSTDDIQRFLTDMDDQNNYAAEKNIFAVGEDMVEQKYKQSNLGGERDKKAVQDLQTLLVSQDLRASAEADNSKEVFGGGRDEQITGRLLSPNIARPTDRNR
jgi:hypothetical protein